MRLSDSPIPTIAGSTCVGRRALFARPVAVYFLGEPAAVEIQAAPPKAASRLERCIGLEGLGRPDMIHLAPRCTALRCSAPEGFPATNQPVG